MSIEMTSKEVTDEVTVKLPFSGTVISTNGHKITSKLNPDAKEFYPAYLMRQKIMREIGDVGGPGQQMHFTNNTNVLKVIKLEEMSVNQVETDVDALRGGSETTLGKAFKEAFKNEILEEMKSETKIDENENEKENKYVPEISGEIVQAATLIKETQETEKQLEDEDLRTSEEDGTDLENFEDAEGEPMAAMKRVKEGEMDMQELTEESERVANKYLTADVLEEEYHEQYSDEQGSNETLNEFKCKDYTESVEVSELSEENELAEEEALQELPHILEEIKEANSLCVVSERYVEADTEVACESVGDGDTQIINEYQSKLTTETGAEFPTKECDAPPNTPTEMSELKSAKLKSPGRSKAKASKEKDDKKKTEKRTTLRKLASISLSLRGKSSSAHHAEKASTRATSATRTKRLSESLHNFTSGLKSKVDGKKAESGGRSIPRSATNIPRPPTARTRPTLTRATTETNGGMSHKSAKARSSSSTRNANRTMDSAATTINNILKDVTSLKSTSSSEHCFTMKSAAQFIKKPLSSKSSKSTGMPSVSVTKSKDSIAKARPRGTLASTLRQNEAQKRRSLFPNADDGASNIELSQFLFK